MSRTSSHLLLVAAAIVAVTVIAACGSSSSTSSVSSTSAGPATQAQAEQAALNFSSCMRSHGAPSFPDPTTGAFKFDLSPDSPDAHSPTFQSAVAACQHLMPGLASRGQPAPSTHAHVVDELAFARCLRSHGFPGFPDPSSTGELSYQMLSAAGINIHQPAVAQAADGCVGVTHGYLTKADVARFIAEH